MTADSFQTDPAYARSLDESDPLRGYREEFHYPSAGGGRPMIYFCGHSLGLQPRGVRAVLEQELEDWARLGVEGHFRGRNPWYSYHETVRDAGARLVGARPDEVVWMNSLTVNLHLMLTSFYRPAGGRYRILIDTPAFPSDLYAVQSQLRLHGYDPDQALLALKPRAGEQVIRLEDVETVLQERGGEIALVLWNAVNFFSGQCFDVPRLVSAAHAQGCLVGLDLAHAAGNIVLNLHDWQVDFAVWCSYKYLNGGPGAVGGCFVHQRHGHDLSCPRLAGWWGNDPATRFDMPPRFVPRAGADGWQISNPPIFSLAPLRASLALFDAAGMTALRQKSERLTAYLLFLLDRLATARFEVITPRPPAERGCQLSIRVHDRPTELLQALADAGVACDFRPPNVIRLAPVPLYNTFEEVWNFVRIIAAFAQRPL